MALADTTENWDDDFEFQPQGSRSAGGGSTLLAGGPLARDKSNELALRQWSEPGPSTPSKQRHVEMETENWDDDFQDKSDSPIRRRISPTAALDASPLSSRRSRRRRPPVLDPDMEPVENWDDEFQENDDGAHMSPSQRSTTWDSSDEDVELGFHGAERDEDRTVTSRARYNGAFTSASSPGHTPPPPVPPIPHMFMSGAHEPAPFPRSPSASVFSVPVSGRDSVAGHSYSSTAHLALRPTLSGSSLGHPLIPPSPPTQHSRERRRLRKKSRPAHVEPNIYELEDIPPSIPRSATPDRPLRRPEPTTPSSLPLDDPDPPPVTPPSAGKSSLASRIGSVGKKWGASRKKRASMGPDSSASASASEKASASGHSRPQSIALPSSPPVSKGAWFFRHGGTANTEAGSGSPPQNSHNSMTLPLKHEKSVDRLLALIGDTPSRRKARIRQGLPPDLTHEQFGTVSGTGHNSPRRPSSMQFSSSSRDSSRLDGMRNASYGQSANNRSRSSSVSRHASASVDDVGSQSSQNMQYFFRTPRKGRQSAEHEHESSQGYRGFMGSVRRLSLRSGSGHGHKAKQDSASSQGTGKEKARPSTSTTATAVPYLPSDFGNDTTPKPASRVLQRPSMDKALLPPIELQPPSPPRTLSGMPSSNSEPTPTLTTIDSLLSPLPASSSTPHPSTHSPHRKIPSSPQQSASLGRTAHPPKEKEDASVAPRRNSLGDLKIPARISQAQIGLRRDLGVVREFAASVEQLRVLQATRDALVSDVHMMLAEAAPRDEREHETKRRATSPMLFGLPRHGRARSSTNPQSLSLSGPAMVHRQLSTTYRSIEAKYAMTWECAELLVELGGGPPPDPPPPPPSTSVSVPASMEQSQSTITPSTHGHHEVRKGRERAVTLGGDEPKPQLPARVISPSSASPQSQQWRASTAGRHDLSHRQLLLLRDMLHTGDHSRSASSSHGHGRISEEAVNRDWHWGEATGSVLTLPSEGSSHRDSILGQDAGLKKRKGSRLGLRGLRDMLKSLRKTVSHAQVRSAPLPPVRLPEEPPLPLPSAHPRVAASSTSIALTESSFGLPLPPPSQERTQSVVQRRQAKTSTEPEGVPSVRDSHPNNPYMTSPSSMSHHTSPRRPSLASIFRLGHKSSKSSRSTSLSTSVHDDNTASTSSCHTHSEIHTEEEDWDKVELSSELPVGADGMELPLASTLRGTKNRSPRSMELLLDGPSTPAKAVANASRSSIWETSSQGPSSSLHSPSSASVSQSYLRTTKLSDVKELVEKEGNGQRRHRRKLSKSRRHSALGLDPSPGRPMSRSGRKPAGTPVSMKSPPSALSSPSYHHLPELGDVHTGFSDSPLSLAMTPENIRPLLENAKEVYMQCSDCIVELRQLLEARDTLSAG